MSVVRRDLAVAQTKRSLANMELNCPRRTEQLTHLYVSASLATFIVNFRQRRGRKGGINIWTHRFPALAVDCFKVDSVESHGRLQRRRRLRHCSGLAAVNRACLREGSSRIKISHPGLCLVTTAFHLSLNNWRSLGRTVDGSDDRWVGWSMGRTVDGSDGPWVGRSMGRMHGRLAGRPMGQYVGRSVGR